MTNYQSFYWQINEDEVAYFFHIIYLANHYQCKFAVFDTIKDKMIKLAVEYSHPNALDNFKNSCQTRMTFTNWQIISKDDFLTARWVFIPNEDTPHHTGVREFMKRWAGYPSGLVMTIDTFLLPYNFYCNEYHLQQVISKIPTVSLLSPPQSKIPTIDDVKTAINNTLSNGDSVSYFRSQVYWDAKIIKSNAQLLMMAVGNIEDKNNSNLFSFKGDIDLTKLITQAIADLCGTMLLDRTNDEVIVIHPK